MTYLPEMIDKRNDLFSRKMCNKCVGVGSTWGLRLHGGVVAT